MFRLRLTGAILRSFGISLCLHELIYRRPFYFRTCRCERIWRECCVSDASCVDGTIFTKDVLEIIAFQRQRPSTPLFIPPVNKYGLVLNAHLAQPTFPSCPPHPRCCCSSFSLPSLRHLITPPSPSSLLEGNVLNGAIGNAALEEPECRSRATVPHPFRHSNFLTRSPSASGTRPRFGFLMVDERAEVSSAQHGPPQTGVLLALRPKVLHPLKAF